MPDRPTSGPLHGLLLICALAGLVISFTLGYRDALWRLEDAASITAQTRLYAFESTLATQRAVAATLADDGLAQEALLTRAPELAHAVSLKLEHLRHETGSTILYLLDPEGVTIAASNWNEPISFVGGDYSFRNYFNHAISNGIALEYALGKDSKRRGLYLSHDIRRDDQLLGVIVVKMEFEPMELAWSRSPDITYVTDPAGRVALSSSRGARPETPPPTPERLVVTQEVPSAPGWSLTVGVTKGAAIQSGIMAAGAMLIIEGLLAFMIWRTDQLRLRARERARAERDYREELERAVEDRTHALTAEMQERQQAEASLARMQGDLVQANKLATLGQITAGLAHEVNQPLATIRLLADNGLALFKSAPDEVQGNLQKIVGMTDRISTIMNNLRGFARKATGRNGPILLGEAIQASIQLTDSRRKVQGARLLVSGVPPDLRVLAEAVRLEQVLVNLIQNAHEAQIGLPDPEIRLTVTTDADMVTIAVSDNGPGLSPDIARQLFTPFATSKSEGLGLGLVIAQGIARDLGGDLLLSPPQEGEGATFLLTVPRAPS